MSADNLKAFLLPTPDPASSVTKAQRAQTIPKELTVDTGTNIKNRMPKGIKARYVPPVVIAETARSAVRPLRIPDGIADMTPRDAALAYAEAGLHVVPVKVGSKNPGSLLGGEWPQKSSADAATIRGWFKRWPTANVGIHPGPSGLLVFDLDKADSLVQLPADIATDLRLAAFQRSRGEGARGHYVFADSLSAGNSAGGWAPWGEVRGKNGFIMAAPSIHPETGEPYRWAKTGDIAPVPSGLRTLIGATNLDFAPALTPDALDAFLDSHTDESATEQIAVMAHAFRGRIADGEARHTAMQGALVGAFRDAREGLYSARRAFETLRDEYRNAFLDAGSRKPSEREFVAMAQWAAAQRAPSESAGHLWTMTPLLAGLHTTAVKWGVSPWALLGEGLLRALLAIPPSHYLPPIIGAPAPVNAFIALVGPSGAGKGIAGGLADLVFVQSNTDTDEDILTGSPGSGEGIPAMYGRYSAKEKRVVYQHTRVYAKFGEIDQLGGMQARQGSTLSALLRDAWSGARLGNTTNETARSNHIAAGRYRFTMSVGVQPERAAGLLDGEAGGLPQRFLWVAATDPDQPMATAEPGERPATVVLPTWGFDRYGWLAEMGANVPHGAWQQTFTVPDQVVNLVRVARHAALNGRVDAIDGHRLLLMEKMALAFAVMHGAKKGFTLEHWEMAERLMLHNDATLQGVRATLRDVARRTADARAANEGRGEIVRSEAADAEVRARCRRRILDILSDTEWMSSANLARKLSAAQKTVYRDVLADLVNEKAIARKSVANNAGSKGSAYRIGASK